MVCAVCLSVLMDTKNGLIQSMSKFIKEFKDIQYPPLW